MSHSFKDSALVNALQSFSLPGIKLYIAEADPRYGESMSTKIEEAIDSSDALLVLLTKRASESASVNQEVGYAKKAHKRIIALVEEGVSEGVLIQGIETIHFSMDRIADALARVSRYVKLKAQDKRRNQLFWVGVFVFGFIIVAVLAIFTFFPRKKKTS